MNSREDLAAAVHALQRCWERTSESWRDEVAATLDRTYREPISAKTAAVARLMEGLEDEFDQAEQEVAG